MKYGFLAAIAIAGVSAWPAFGQTAKPAAKPSEEGSKNVAAKTAAGKKFVTPRTPWGDPDLQGVWNDATSTPLERPGGVTGKNVLNDEEAAEFQNQLEYNLTRDRRDGGNDIDVNRAYNEHWMDARRLKITADRRTSLIVDPPEIVKNTILVAAR